MGLLDDAIKQHLELKRQHGAAEEELQRQEEEALGPARRDVAPADAAGGDEELELEAPETAEDAPVAEAAPEAHEEESVPQEPESLLEEEPENALGEPESEAAAEPGAPAPYDAAGDIPGFEEEEVGEEALEAPQAGDDELFDEEDEGESEPSDADVLEDTPDFLQETPEHDRLWFEQKPPRDFDFD